jgi:putative ABC transport system permease protein
MFGVMKAQGISSGYIAKSVLAQTFLLMLSGSIVGIILTLVSGFFLGGMVPFAVNILFYAVILLSFFVFSFLGGLFSVGAIVKVDPIKAIG